MGEAFRESARRPAWQRALLSWWRAVDAAAGPRLSAALEEWRALGLQARVSCADCCGGWARRLAFGGWTEAPVSSVAPDTAPSAAAGLRGLLAEARPSPAVSPSPPASPASAASPASPASAASARARPAHAVAQVTPAAEDASDDDGDWEWDWDAA
jgi:hypothetical protein